MIDEDRTMQLFGYTSGKWAPKSGKHIVVVCEECGKYRIVKKQMYRDLCKSCASIKRSYIPDFAVRSIDYTKTSKRFGYHASELSPSSDKKVVAVCVNCGKRRVTRKCKYRDMCPQCVAKTTHHRIKTSAIRQGISYDEWESFARDASYCPNFNNACRESNREKYDRRCFLCNKTETENGRRLSVHHVDMNKDQGCAGHTWKLVPLCIHHHASSSHTEAWVSRIEYLLNHVWE